MYYLIDEDGMEFEATTLIGLLTKAQEEASYFHDTFEQAVERGAFSIFKGSRVKVKVIPPKYEEVKPIPAKKATTKKPVKKGAK